MSYKNTMKLFASNFSIVWKQLVYLLGCLVLLIVCSYTTIKPVIELLEENNIAGEFDVLFKSVYDSPNEIGLKISDIIKNIITIIVHNFAEIYVSLFFAIILCVILPSVLIQMSIFNLSSLAYQRTTMNMNCKYSQNAIKTFKSGLKYALANIIFTFPFSVLNFVLIMLYVSIAKSILSALIGLVALSALTIFVQSLKLAIFANYTGRVISEPQNLFKAFAKSSRDVFKKFWKSLSTSIILHLTIVVVNGFVLVFTFFAGLFVSVPATFVLIAFYYIVSYLHANGERYYLSDTIIYNPVEYVVKKDNFVTIAIPEVTTEMQVQTTKIKKSYKNKN